MNRQELNKALDGLLGADHHDRNDLLVRNGRWGTCGACPREGGRVHPEKCLYTDRGDHRLDATSAAMELIMLFKQGRPEEVQRVDPSRPDDPWGPMPASDEARVVEME